MLGIDFSRNQKLALIALAAISIIGLSYGRIRNAFGGASGEVVVREPGQAGASGVIDSGSDTMPFDKRNGSSIVVVHVAGCVKSPGVYRLPENDRVIDAIDAAGGALSGANIDSLNLAAKIEDGSKIYVPPMMGGTIPQTNGKPDYEAVARAALPKNSSVSLPSGSASSNSGGKLKNPGDGVVHINSASAEELQRLPGVGPSTAQKIIEHRSQIGSFSSVDQLMDVKGIGPKKLEKMKPFVEL